MLKYLEKISHEAKHILKDLNVDKAFQSNENIRVAVTGLSRTGKTLFITSLVNQIISGKRLQNLGKEFKAEIISSTDETAQFKYRDILEQLRKEPPEWPKSTKSISKIVVKIEVKSESSFFPNKILFLEIVDYPGEWLFDMAMHGKSFEEWSLSVFEDIKDPDKRMYATDFQRELNTHDIYGFSNGADDQKVIDAYRKYQNNLQNNGYSVIQPGRNFQTGSFPDASLLLFTPLLKPQKVEPHEDSIYSRFKNRYDRYLEKAVKPLVEEHFSHFDRQIILVDVLKSLQKGYNSFLDMTKAVRKFTEIYNYGQSGKFLKGIRDRRIDKILFSATKADSIPSTQMENFQLLLNSIVEEAKKELSVSGLKTKTLVLSSVKSTTEVQQEFQGNTLDCVRGRLIGKMEESIEHVGEIPANFPTKRDWGEKKFSFPEFSPIPFPDRDIDSVININMDKAIEYILGDKL
jgi:predicted YcjX-like family ATPase